jgi:hypothetical protein
MAKNPDWTDAEHEVLRQLYPLQDKQAIMAALPGRTWNAIRMRAHRLGVGVKKHYTATEDKKLALLWDSGLRLSAIAEEMGGRTPQSLYDRGVQLGLTAGCPEGFEYITDAADRTGYEVETLRNIMRWAGVRRRMAISDPSRRGKERPAAWHRHFVCPLEIDDAVERWHATETVNGAARARGLTDMTLARWLTQAGVLEVRPKGAPRVVRRVPSEVIDRVVAERQRAA